MIYKSTTINPNDGEHDTIDSSRMHQIEPLKTSLEVKGNGNNTYELKYSFTEEVDGEVYLTATCSDINFLFAQKLEMQKFTDEISSAARNKKSPDSTEYLISLKEIATTALGSALLKIGKVVIGSKYEFFGFILSGEERVGTLDGIKFTTNDEIELFDCTSIGDISNMIELNIEIEFNNKYYIGTLTHKRDYVFNIKDFIEIERDFNFPEIKEKSTYLSNEDFVKDRQSLISLNQNDENFDIDEFSDLF